MASLLIHGDPGARNSFLAGWLTKKLVKPSFDTGWELGPSYLKVHNFVKNGEERIKSFQGTRIRIRPTLTMVDNHVLLYLRKNRQRFSSNFTRDEYSLETFSDLWCFIKECFEHDTQVDYSLYDYVINFEDTYNTQIMTDLYQKILLNTPSDRELEIFHETNKINNIPLDSNHAASLVKLILEQEQLLQVTEEQRRWSIVNIYKSTSKEQLHDVIKNTIVRENYATTG